MFCLECERNLNWFQGQPASQLEFWKFYAQIRHFEQYLIVIFADFFGKMTTVFYFFLSLPSFDKTLLQTEQKNYKYCTIIAYISS